MSKLWKPTRRLFLAGGAAGIIAAPAIVRAGTLPLLGVGKQPAAAGLGLQTSLTAFWQFETTSWTDELGTNNLTGTNSPTSVAGLVGNAVKFDSGASMKLAHASATAMVMDTSNWSFQLWANLATATATNRGDLMSKTTGGFGNSEYSIGTIFSSNHFWFWRYTDTNTDSQTLTSTTALATGWHHLVGTWDGTTMKLYVDAGTADSATPALGPATSTSDFEIGQAGTGGYASATYDVKVDQVGLWKGRVLTAGNVTSLYNSGAGLSYAAMA